MPPPRPFRPASSPATRFLLPWFAFILAGAALRAAAVTAPSADPLRDGFLQPPASARPRVWWHWMNGNISKPGIRADLEWMHRAGLGGIQVFDAALATPQVVDHRLAYMTPAWKDAFRYATTLSDRLGFEMAIAGSPGWSETGGPWVTAAEAMKKYVWSETTIEGGRPFSGRLPQPPTVAGPFQATPAVNSLPEIPPFYRDAAVVAFRTPATEAALPAGRVTVSSGAAVDPRALQDGNLSTFVALRKPRPRAPAWLEIAFPAPVTIRAVTLSVGPQRRGPAQPATLEASKDGVAFQPVARLELPLGEVHTCSLPPVTACCFRLIFNKAAPAPGPVIAVNEFGLHRGARVNRFETKAGFQTARDLYAFATPATEPAAVIPKADVIDLSGHLHSDGTFAWTPPPGRWTVLRLGYTLTGKTNHPATKEATGLEVDKLDRGHVRAYMDGYLDSYRDTVGAGLMGKHGIQYVITDSWEAGTQNWTDAMLAQFQRRRGYDPRPWLPVLAGHVVESARASDRFLWDFRKTIADLTADEHYGQIEASLRARHMGHYGESHESGRAFVGDGMEVKKLDDIPMGAMWTATLHTHPTDFTHNADDRETASVAHIYGQNLAAAESMTAAYDPWAWSPATLKPTADQEFLNGINRFVIHESAHQPLMDKAPGLTLGRYGQWFNRNETWAGQARPWIDYLARTSYLLQQGRFVADVLYYYGEDSNITALFGRSAPPVPAGYDFDYINADGLIHAVTANGGELTTKSGMRYRVLALDPFARHMSLPVLRAIHALVQSGAVVVGAKPDDDPSLADDPAEFARLNDELFGDGRGVHPLGRGTVFAGQNLAEALAALHVSPDFDYTKPEPDTDLEFVHRVLPGADLYFVDNRSDREETVDATFRVAGRAPELWSAETGTTARASYTIADGRTTVPLHLGPWGTTFVVFRHPTTATSHVEPKPVETTLASVEGPWNLTFQPGRGAPPSITLAALTPWNENADPGVKYFSGIGTYSRTVEAPPAWLTAGDHVWLDLGDVKNLADVTVNGKELGVVWHPPYRIDVTAALHAGTNELSIKVVNAWVNRLIGDQQPGATPVAWADVTPYHADSPLLPSGLLGPVRLIRQSSR